MFFLQLHSQAILDVLGLGGGIPSPSALTIYKTLLLCACFLFTGNVYMIQTTTEYDFTQAVLDTNTNHLTFSVQACNDVHLALSSSSDISPQNTYELVVGGYGNSRLVLSILSAQ